jgi:hypothetical protein
MAQRRRLKIHVKNLGPIPDASLTFADLTILIGPQASGKSISLLKLLVDTGVRSRSGCDGTDWTGVGASMCSWTRTSARDARHPARQQDARLVAGKVSRPCWDRETPAQGRLVHYYDGATGKIHDVSRLDPSVPQQFEAAWGGLTEFTERANREVAVAVASDRNEL